MPQGCWQTVKTFLCQAWDVLSLCAAFLTSSVAIIVHLYNKKKDKKQEIRNLIADFKEAVKPKEEGKEDNIGNGFEFSDSISDIEKIREQRKNIHRYNAVKTEAELYLSILDMIVKEPCEKYRKEYEVILRPYVTKKRADCYYCYLFITDQFPELLKRKEELKQKGFFRLPPSNRATDMTDKELEHWGKNMRKHLLP